MILCIQRIHHIIQILWLRVYFFYKNILAANSTTDQLVTPRSSLRRVPLDPVLAPDRFILGLIETLCPIPEDITSFW